MLKQRVITAVVLVALLVAAVWLLALPALALLLAGLVLVAGWEWSNLAGYQATWSRVLYALTYALPMLSLYVFGQLGAAPSLAVIQPVFGAACLWWAIALLWMQGYPTSAQFWGNKAMLSLMGMLVLVPAWLAVVFLLSFPHGGLLLLFMVVLVACADVGAYFVGKAWGKRKLAPAVSPGKSWEGFWGGMAACAALAVTVHFALQPTQVGLAGIVAIVLCSALASVLGDLLESMVKRHRGVKDSGTLLPGHGGLLDRIDGHTAGAPVFALGLILAGW